MIGQIQLPHNINCQHATVYKGIPLTRRFLNCNNNTSGLGVNENYRKTPNKRPSLHPRPHVGVFFHVFGYISAENGPIFIP